MEASISRASCTIDAVSTFRVSALAFAFVFSAPAQQEGMIPRWQVEQLTQDIVHNVETAAEVVVALRPEEWIRDGAPEAYVEQHRTLLEEMEHVKLAAQALGREPERLTYAVDAFLWLDRVEALLASVSAGARRYYNGAVADLLDSARNRNSDGIAAVKQYMRQVAAHVEGSMEVAHREAQRCREQIAAQPQQR